MRTIAPGKEPITTLWSTHPEKTARYRMIRYHIRTEYEEGVLLLNTVTGELVQLNVEEDQLLEHLPGGYTPEMDELIAHRFLVPEGFDELVSITQLRKIIRSLSYPGNEVVGYTILPTSICNARCFYCYESDFPHCSMSKETTNKLVDFIVAHSGVAKEVSLSWFGGEPTLGEKCIDGICESLKKKGISFTSSMISNGYLFTKAMARKAREKWQLRNIQITLDGTEEVYNNVKAYVNSEGSPYLRVINNIGYLLDEKIHVSVRMNLDRHNADNLMELIDELAKRFSNTEYFSVYVHELFDGMGFEPIYRTEEEMQNIIEKKMAIESYIDDKRLKRSVKTVIKELPFLKSTYCMADNPSSLLVNPEGGFGKCQHTQYEHLVGNLQADNVDNKDEIRYWLEYLPQKGCQYCQLSPSCGVPQTCASGRACISVEVDKKVGAIEEFCRKVAVNNNGLED